MAFWTCVFIFEELNPADGVWLWWWRKNKVVHSCWLRKGNGGRLLHFKKKTEQDFLKYLIMHVSCCTSLVYHRILWVKENYNNVLYTGANWRSILLKMYTMCPALHAFKDISWLKSVSCCSNETLAESTSVQLNKTLVIMHRFKLVKIQKTSLLSSPFHFQQNFQRLICSCPIITCLFTFFMCLIFLFFSVHLSFSISCSLKIKAAFSLALS